MVDTAKEVKKTDNPVVVDTTQAVSDTQPTTPTQQPATQQIDAKNVQNILWSLTGEQKQQAIQKFGIDTLTAAAKWQKLDQAQAPVTTQTPAPTTTTPVTAPAAPTTPAAPAQPPAQLKQGPLLAATDG